MKKIVSIIFICITILGIMGCNSEKRPGDKQESQKELFLLGLTLDDGRQVSFTTDIPYKKSSTLFDALTYNKLTIEEFLNQLELIDTLKDGTFKLYQYNPIQKTFGNDEFYAIACNSLDNINDIYIAKHKESLNDKCSLKIDDLENVSMKIKDNTLTRTGATVIITDMSDRKNIYGEGYTLEKMENGVWVALKPIHNMVFVSIGYFVDENHTLELKTNWEHHYGKLENGTYRILKSTSEAGEGTQHYITSEFVIE